MSTDNDAFQYLLQGMRAAFLDDLPERCDQCDNLLLALEKTPDDRALFDELFRAVHNLKGAGGTHGLHIITRICHPLENCLGDMKTPGRFKGALERALKYVDLMRRVEAPGRTENPDYSAIERELEALRQSALQSGKSCLLAEPSSMMVNVYKNVLARHSIQFSSVGNGMEALSRLLHEPFDLIIAGRELPELNGLALVAALRASPGHNQNIPVILVTSNSDNLPEWGGQDTVRAAAVREGSPTVAPASGRLAGNLSRPYLDAVLPRDNRLPASLEAALQNLKW